MSLAYLLAAEADKHVVIAMLITGLVFVAVIALGETLHWLRGRRGSH